MGGKTIRISLVDDGPTGVLTAEIINWAGNRNGRLVWKSEIGVEASPTGTMSFFRNPTRPNNPVFFS